MSLLTDALNDLRTHCPKAWQMVDQRVFRGVDAFGDYRWPRLRWATILAHVTTNEDVNPTFLEDIEIRRLVDVQSFHLHAAHGFPTYFVSKRLFEAVLHTDITFDVEWQQMNLPFPGWTFVLPPNEFDLDVIMIDRIKVADLGVDTIINSVTGESGEDGLLDMTAYSPNGRSVGLHIFNTYHPDRFHVKIDGMRDLRQATARIVFNLIFAMAARPEYIELGKRSGTHKKSGSELWTPNIIGRKYAMKRASDTPPKGEHASPRMHWRRGHFRHQPFGHRLSQTKVIWIEPMLINAP